MDEEKLPQSKEEILRDLFNRAASLWGKKHAQQLHPIMEEMAEKMLSISANLPLAEDVPTLTWHNHP